MSRKPFPSKFTLSIQSILINLQTFSLQSLLYPFFTELYLVSDLRTRWLQTQLLRGLAQLFTERSAAAPPYHPDPGTDNPGSTSASPKPCQLDSDARLSGTRGAPTLPEARGELARRFQTRIFGRGDLVFRAHFPKGGREKGVAGEETPLTVSGRVASGSRWALRPETHGQPPVPGRTRQREGDGRASQHRAIPPPSGGRAKPKESAGERGGEAWRRHPASRPTAGSAEAVPANDGNHLQQPDHPAAEPAARDLRLPDLGRCAPRQPARGASGAVLGRGRWPLPVAVLGFLSVGPRVAQRQE